MIGSTESRALLSLIQEAGTLETVHQHPVEIIIFHLVVLQGQEVFYYLQIQTLTLITFQEHMVE